MRHRTCAMYTDLFYLIRVFELLVKKLLALRKQKYMIKVVFLAGSHKPLSTFIMFNDLVIMYVKFIAFKIFTRKSGFLANPI